MWAYLVVREVQNICQEKRNLTEIENRIDNILVGLSELYSSIFDDANDESKTLMRWICFLVWPLLIDELRWVIALSKTGSYHSLQEYEANHAIQDLDTTIEHVYIMMRGLAEVVESDGQDVIEFIHESVKTF